MQYYSRWTHIGCWLPMKLKGTTLKISPWAVTCTGCGQEFIPGDTRIVKYNDFVQITECAARITDSEEYARFLKGIKLVEIARRHYIK